MEQYNNGPEVSLRNDYDRVNHLTDHNVSHIELNNRSFMYLRPSGRDTSILSITPPVRLLDRLESKRDLTTEELELDTRRVQELSNDNPRVKVAPRVISPGSSDRKPPKILPKSPNEINRYTDSAIRPKTSPREIDITPNEVDNKDIEVISIPREENIKNHSGIDKVSIPRSPSRFNTSFVARSNSTFERLFDPSLAESLGDIEKELYNNNAQFDPNILSMSGSILWKATVPIDRRVSIPMNHNGSSNILRGKR